MSGATQPPDRVVEVGALPDVPLHIVLVEPEIPPNTGNVARLCAATGAALHLVEPLGFAIDDRSLKRAGLDYWERMHVVIHRDLDAFLQTPIARRMWLLSTRAHARYDGAAFAYGDALVFGRETKGLPQELLDRFSERTLRIPMREGSVRSINLSTAVGIVTFAALQRLGFPNLL